MILDLHYMMFWHVLVCFENFYGKNVEILYSDKVNKGFDLFSFCDLFS